MFVQVVVLLISAILISYYLKMSTSFRILKMNNGLTIPVIGLGVYQSAAGDECYNAVLTALRAGYRHIDTAQIYRNEADVGRAVVDSGIPREQIFITTKLWLNNFGRTAAKAAIDTSLSKLQTSYVDLLLLHAPGEPKLRAETWKALEELHHSGVLKSIGVSNFGQDHLEKLAQTAEVTPAVNQIEIHPWCQRTELVNYCKEKGIVVQAYSPLAKANKLTDPLVTAIAARHGKTTTTAQVLIAWSLQKGLVTLPKSVHPERIVQNLAAHDLVLSSEDMNQLDSLEEYYVTGWDPIKDAPV
jgi:diketogulonate reductase-like aldo/keto reductase